VLKLKQMRINPGRKQTIRFQTLDNLY